MPKTSRVLCVVGMGRSGEAAARLALREGHAVRLLERRDDEETVKKASILRLLGVEVLLGEHRQEMFKDVGEIVVSPGVPTSAEIFSWAAKAGIEVMGELEWSSRRFNGKLVAVTGTNGKTTTTALIAHLLNENGIPAVACGNIGVPLAQVILSDQIPQIAVIEVSSFQLETIHTFHPAVSIFLNFTPDHLDRHANLNEYWLAKLRMFKNQGAGDWALLHSDLSERLQALMESKRLNWATFGLDERKADVSIRDEMIHWKRKGSLCDRQDVGLIGDHNLENACAALATVALLGTRNTALGDSMRNFHPVDHRLQPIARIGGVRFINDSKATNVDSLAVALRSFPDKVVLIAGGRDKNQDFAPLRMLIQEKVKALVLLGEGAEKMAKQWEGTSEVVRVTNLQEAVRTSWQKAQPTGEVLLSPACASFDMFRDYEHRGKEFVRCVEALEREEG